MGQFGNSFAEAFEKSYQTGAAGQQDILKEKIKQDQAKAAEKYKATSLRNANIALATQFADPDVSKKIITVAEAVGDSSAAQKAVNEFSKTMLTQQIKQTATGNKPTFMVGRNKDTGLPETRNAITGEVVTDVSQIPGNAAVFKENLSVDEIVDRARGSKEASKQVEAKWNPIIAADVEKAKQDVKLDYPTLDEKGRGALAAYKYIGPRIEKLNGLIDSGVFGKGQAERLTKQIIAGPKGELIVPDGSPLEEVVGLYNDIKLNGFQIAGTAFTGTEKETAFALLDPRGKSDERIKRDLESFRDYFGTRVEAQVGGLREAKKVAQEVKDKRNSVVNASDNSGTTKVVGNTTYEKRADGKWYPKKA